MQVRNFEVNKEQQLTDNGNIGQFYRYVNKIVAKTGIGAIKSDTLNGQIPFHAVTLQCDWRPPSRTNPI